MNLGQNGSAQTTYSATAPVKKKIINKGEKKTSQGHQGEIELQDSLAVSLFVNFYKLLFLGTDFAHKMLKVTLEKGNQSNEPRKIIINDGNKTDEEGRMSDTQFMNDTSDIMSSDQNTIEATHEGSVQSTDRDPDPYFKIKLNASLALRNIVRNNNSAIFNYWYVLFPTFMMRPQTEFAFYIKEMKSFNTQKQFISKVFPEIEAKEPTLFYIILQKQT